MALSQWERERFNYGESAGDGKGDYLHTHGVKAEHAMVLLFSWLSGSASEVILPNTLPMSRGGTGSTTATGFLKNLGYFMDANYTLRRGTKVISVSNDGLTDHFNNVPTARFERIGLGTYKLTGFEVDPKTWQYVIPVTPEGLPKYVLETNVIGDEMTLYCYTANTDAWPIRKGTQVDLAVGDVINYAVK